MKNLNKSLRVTIFLSLCIILGFLGEYVCGGDNIGLPEDPYSVSGIISYDDGNFPQNVIINVTNTGNGNYLTGGSNDYDAPTGIYSIDISTIGYSEGEHISVSVIDEKGNQGNGGGIINIKAATTRIDIVLKDIVKLAINEKIETDKTIDKNMHSSNISEETNKNISKNSADTGMSLNEKDKSLEKTDDFNKTKSIDSEKTDKSPLNNEKTTASKTNELSKNNIIWGISLIILILIIFLLIWKTIKK